MTKVIKHSHAILKLQKFKYPAHDVTTLIHTDISDIVGHIFMLMTKSSVYNADTSTI